jgi:hypothetical protein
MKMDNTAIGKRGMAWTIGQLDKWTKETLENSSVSVMWRSQQTRDPEVTFSVTASTPRIRLTLDNVCVDVEHYHVGCDAV